MRRYSYAKFITRLTDNRGIDRGASMILIILPTVWARFPAVDKCALLIFQSMVSTMHC